MSVLCHFRHCFRLRNHLSLSQYIRHHITIGLQGGNNTEETPTKMTKELSCELDPDSGLLCSNSELGLCVLHTDLTEVGGGKITET
jgi:hypothetical protein